MKKHYLGLYIQVFVKEMLCIKTDIPLRIICKHVSFKINFKIHKTNVLKTEANAKLLIPIKGIKVRKLITYRISVIPESLTGVSS